MAQLRLTAYCSLGTIQRLLLFLNQKLMQCCSRGLVYLVLRHDAECKRPSDILQQKLQTTRFGGFFVGCGIDSYWQALDGSVPGAFRTDAVSRKFATAAIRARGAVQWLNMVC